MSIRNFFLFLLCIFSLFPGRGSADCIQDYQYEFSRKSWKNSKSEYEAVLVLLDLLPDNEGKVRKMVSGNLFPVWDINEVKEYLQLMVRNGLLCPNGRKPLKVSEIAGHYNLFKMNSLRSVQKDYEENKLKLNSYNLDWPALVRYGAEDISEALGIYEQIRKNPYNSQTELMKTILDIKGKLPIYEIYEKITKRMQKGPIEPVVRPLLRSMRAFEDQLSLHDDKEAFRKAFDPIFEKERGADKHFFKEAFYFLHDFDPTAINSENVEKLKQIRNPFQVEVLKILAKGNYLIFNNKGDNQGYYFLRLLPLIKNDFQVKLIQELARYGQVISINNLSNLNSPFFADAIKVLGGGNKSWINKENLNKLKDFSENFHVEVLENLIQKGYFSIDMKNNVSGYYLDNIPLIDNLFAAHAAVLFAKKTNSFLDIGKLSPIKTFLDLKRFEAALKLKAIPSLDELISYVTKKRTKFQDAKDEGDWTAIQDKVINYFDYNTCPRNIGRGERAVNVIGQVLGQVKVKLKKKDNESCVICSDDFAPSEIMECPSCNLGTCPACLKRGLELDFKEKKFPLGCFSCHGALSLNERDLEKLGFGKNDIRQWKLGILTQRFKQKFPNSKPCYTPDCPNLLCEQGRDRSGHLTCPVCEGNFCFNCGDQHPRESCRDHLAAKKGDDGMKKLISQGIVRPCYHCKSLLQKSDGCNRIKCGNCKNNNLWDPNSNLLKQWKGYEVHNLNDETWKGVPK